MGHTRRDNLKEYWSTDPVIEIPIFSVIRLQVLSSATPQRGMFQEIPHSQALLAALVFPKNFSS
jgi:hypothetical protein